MGQNGHANVLVMRKSKNTITVVKKAHTIKNLVLGGLHTRKVNYLSQTYAGKRHDKKIADEESPTYPEDISLYKDTGFQGGCGSFATTPRTLISVSPCVLCCHQSFPPAISCNVGRAVGISERLSGNKAF